MKTQADERTTVEDGRFCKDMKSMHDIFILMYKQVSLNSSTVWEIKVIQKGNLSGRPNHSNFNATEYSWKSKPWRA